MGPNQTSLDGFYIGQSLPSRFKQKILKKRTFSEMTVPVIYKLHQKLGGFSPLKY